MDTDHIAPSAKPAEAIDPVSVVEAIMGPPQLFKNEKIEAYRTLLGKVREAVKPSDIIEEIAVYDIVGLVWQNLRLNRWKKSLMETCSHEGLRRIMALLVQDTRNPHIPSQLLRPSPADDLVNQYAFGVTAAKERVGTVLASADLGDDAIMAQTLASQLELFEHIDRLMMQNEARRHVALREIDRRRSAFARRLDNAVDDISDADYDAERCLPEGEW